MKTYRGERTEGGCAVTVDGEPLHPRSDLSGNASNAFDWGFIGTGQLSMAMLADFLGDDLKARSMCEAFEKEVIAELPRGSWTLTGQDLCNVFAPLAVVDGATNLNDNDAKMVRDNRAQSLKKIRKSSEERAAHMNTKAMSDVADGMANAANHVVVAAIAVSQAAYQVAHTCDQPADEAMSTANRAADQKADATNRVVDEAAALARLAVDEANHVVAKLHAKPA